MSSVLRQRRREPNRRPWGIGARARVLPRFDLRRIEGDLRAVRSAIREARNVQADVLPDGDAYRRLQRTVAADGTLAARTRVGVAIRDRGAGESQPARLRNAVVVDLGEDRDRLADLHAARLDLDDSDGRRLVAADLRAARPGAERAGLRRLDEVVEDVIGPQRGVRLLRSSVRRERPHELVLRAEAVLGANRDVDLLLPVPVHVAEDEVLLAVRRLLPSFIGGRDVLTARVGERLSGERHERGAERADDGRQPDDPADLRNRIARRL